MIRNSAMIITTNKGRRGFITFSIVVLAIPTPTNNTEPTGGVHKPIQRFKIIIIPKCTGSNPSFITTGKNMGVNMSTAGVISIKMPTNRSKRFMISKMIILLSLILNKPVLIS